ncbi:MAG: M1 family aminopeptidase [Nakamurella sp.]
MHPFLTHYQTDNGDNTCSPSGSTGTWSAATGDGEGPEQWRVDLSAYAGKQVEVSITYASDDVVQNAGIVIDDIVVSTGQGSTSFENDGDVLDGWTVPGAPSGSTPNANDWVVGSSSEMPSPGKEIERTLTREPEIIGFLAQNFGRYPFTAAGGIVDDVTGLGFALENQTRPIYARDFFTDYAAPNYSVVAHELTHQWFGDSLAVERWKDIWLNEGFATYAEWLWSEHEGTGTAQQISDFYLGTIPGTDPFWQLTIGDPGPEELFNPAVYYRGGLTLHALRLQIGDDNFFELLRTWAQDNAGGNVTTDQFIALAEQISGQHLGAFFTAWLYTGSKPVPDAAAVSAAANARTGAAPAAVDPSATGRSKLPSRR